MVAGALNSFYKCPCCKSGWMVREERFVLSPDLKVIRIKYIYKCYECDEFVTEIEEVVE